MHNVIVLGLSDAVPEGYRLINCSSRSLEMEWRELSPFVLGPVQVYDGLTSKTVENAWQYTKVYQEFIVNGKLQLKPYMEWRNRGFNLPHANRYPMGRGAKPVASLWRENGEWVKLNYIDARKKIYVPLYCEAVVKTQSYQNLVAAAAESDIALVDFDSYDNSALGLSISDVINNPNRKLGHAFLLAMLLNNQGAIVL